MLGAEGVSIGTAFLATHECTRVGKAWREQILSGVDTSTKIVARGLMPLRLLVNRSLREIEGIIASGGSKKDIRNFIFRADWTGDRDGPFPAGQALGLIKAMRTAREVVEGFVSDAENLLQAKGDRFLRS